MHAFILYPDDSYFLGNPCGVVNFKLLNGPVNFLAVKNTTLNSINFASCHFS